MSKFALINNGVVEVVTDFDPHAITLLAAYKQQYDDVVEVKGEVAVEVGYLYQDGGFKAPPPPPDPRPEVVVTGVVGDTISVSPEFTEITMYENKAGKKNVVTVTAQIEKDGQVLPVTNTFLMPVDLRSSSAADVNSDRFIAQVVEGVMTLPVSFKDSGTWEVTDAGINSQLPESNHFRIRGGGLIRFIVVRDVNG